jgi:nicotinamide-nucleotide amidase
VTLEVGGAIGPRASAVVVAVGDELLSGRTVDTNSAWLGRVLAEAGIPVLRRATVADELPEIAGAVDDALARAELVVVTGGLGPTPDDRTVEAVAGLLGTPLREDPVTIARIRERYRARGLGEPPRSNFRQALVPEGSEVLPNPRGTAPGVFVAHRGRWILLLPGVPAEMRALVESFLLPRLPALFPGRLAPIRTRTLRTTGIPESALAERLAPMIAHPAFAEVRVAFLPRATGVEVGLSIPEGEGAAGALSGLEEAMRREIEPWFFAGPDLVDDVAEALQAAGLRLAAAESCTGGLVSGRLTGRPGSSAWFPGGIVAYANEVKAGILGVDPGVIEAFGAVSEPVAHAMAEGARTALGAECGIAITGVAGPGGGTETKPVGTVWVAAVTPHGARAVLHRFPGDRAEIRERSAQAALYLLLSLLREGGPSGPGSATRNGVES